MGAQHKFDLTSDVTHLIVGNYDTPKYRYVAKERPDVKVLTSGWIEAVRQLWIEDKAIDIEAIEKDYTLPTFSTLQICMTGFEDRELCSIGKVFKVFNIAQKMKDKRL
jgi:DNA replication regulator DPB11